MGEGRLSPGNDGDGLTCGCGSSRVDVVDGAVVVVGKDGWAKQKRVGFNCIQRRLKRGE